MRKQVVQPFVEAATRLGAVSCVLGPDPVGVGLRAAVVGHVLERVGGELFGEGEGNGDAMQLTTKTLRL